MTLGSSFGLALILWTTRLASTAGATTCEYNLDPQYVSPVGQSCPVVLYFNSYRPNQPWTEADATRIVAVRNGVEVELVATRTVIDAPREIVYTAYDGCTGEPINTRTDVETYRRVTFAVVGTREGDELRVTSADGAMTFGSFAVSATARCTDDPLPATSCGTVTSATCEVLGEDDGGCTTGGGSSGPACLVLGALALISRRRS